MRRIDWVGSHHSFSGRTVIRSAVTTVGPWKKRVAENIHRRENQSVDPIWLWIGGVIDMRLNPASIDTSTSGRLFLRVKVSCVLLTLALRIAFLS